MSPYYPSANRLIIVTIAFIIGIVLGIGSLLPFRPSGRPHVEAPAPQAATAHLVTYETYLLLGVDAFENDRPRVEAVWLVMLPSDDSVVEMIGLPPAFFKDQYNPETGLPISSIGPYLRGAFAGALVFDRGDVVELTNRLDGVWLAGNQVDGEGLLGFIDSADQSQPREVLIRQAAAVQSVIAKMAAAGPRANFVSLFDGASLMLTDRVTLFDAFSQYYPLKTDRVRVRFRDG